VVEEAIVISKSYPRSFQDSNNEKVGDLKGIIDSLDYISISRRNRHFG